MSDDVNGGRRSRRGAQRVLMAAWDQLLLLVVFGYLITITVEYPKSARQFPLAFLIVGFCFLIVQFVSEILPPEYGNRIQNLTQGMADEMEMDNPEATESPNVSDGNSSVNETTQGDNDTLPATDPSESKTQSDRLSTDVKKKALLTSRFTRFAGILGLLAVFVGISYLFGFIYAIPVFILGTIGVLGNRDWTVGVVTVVFVSVVIFLLFGQVLNVPITDGLYQVPVIGELVE